LVRFTVKIENLKQFMMKQLLTLIFAICLASVGLHAQCNISENFDTYNNGEVPTDWTMIDATDGTSSYGRVTSNPSAPSPGKYFRMYSGNATTGDLVFISPMETTTSDGNHRLTFFAQGATESNLIVGTTDAADGSGTFTTIETITLQGINNENWEAHEVIIPSGTDQYIFFQHNLGSTFDQVNIDSVCLQTIPTCLEVENVEVSNQTQFTIDLSWTESGTGEDNWEYVVQEAGEGEPTTNGTPFNSTDANPTVTITDLDSNTDYEAYVRSDCGGGDYGAWIKSNGTIRTDCAPITENYCEDWAGQPEDEVPFCWDAVDDANPSGYVKIDFEFSYNKNMLEMFASSVTVGDLIAISPDVSAFATDGAHRLRIQAGGSTATGDLLEVGTIDGSGIFVEITSIALTSDREAEYLVTLPDNGHTNFAFKHSGEINKFVWINSVCVEDLPSCLEVTDVTASNVDFDSADLSWTASESNETTWEYLVQEASLPAPDAATNGTEITTTSVTVPLEQNTAYKAYVRSKCDTDDFGAWIASDEFTSACSSFVAEYQFGFEGPNVSGEDIKPCWSIFDTTVGDFKTYGTSFDIDPYDGDLMLRMFFANTADPEGLAVITPEFSDLNTDKQIRFRMNNRANNEADFNIIVGTVADPSDLSTFQALDNTSLNQSTIVADTWTEFTIDLSGYDSSLNHSYIVFKPQHSGTGPWQYVFMDDFNYEYAEPQGLNDEPETAAVLTISDDYTCNNAITGDFTGATKSEEFPCTIPTYDDYTDLWYRFTPTASGEYALGIKNPNGEDMNMSIWEGGSNNLEQIGSGCSTRFTSLELNAGETYFVAIASPVPSAQYSLCVSQYPEIPANDEPIGAFELIESTDSNCNNAVEGYTASATYSSDSDCSSETDDVWYSFVPDATANYTFKRTVINGGAVTSTSVYSGTPGNMTQLTEGCTTYLQTVDLTAGETYYVAVSSSGGSIPLYFNLCAYPSPPAPANDECANGFELTVGEDFETSFIIGDNTSATRNPNDPLVGCDGLEFEEKGKDVWYTVTIPNSGNLTLETKTNNDPYQDDTGMQAYIGECGALNSLVCSADNGEYFFNLIELTNFEPGTEILVRVWGRVGNFGSYKIAAYDDSPECNFPTDVTVSDITETTAMLSWNEPTPAPTGGYEYIVQDAGLGYPSGAEGTFTNGTEVLLENLAPLTEYDVYVKANCSTNGSAWAGPITFTTEDELGISDFNKNQFKLYPNPVNDVVNVSYKTEIDSISIYSITGQLVYDNVIHTSSAQINVSHLSSGLYILEANVEGNKVRFKIIVE